MKKFSFSLLLLFFLFSVVYGQTIPKKDTTPKPNVEITKEGNYIQKTSTSSCTDTKTDKIFTDKEGNVYPVYKSKNDKLYVNRVSKKTGNTYRFYLKVEDNKND